MNKNYRTYVLWGLIALSLVVIFSFYNRNEHKATISQLTYSNFLEKINKGEIKAVNIQGAQLTGQADLTHIYRL